eukprot:441293_1
MGGTCKCCTTMNSANPPRNTVYKKILSRSTIADDSEIEKEHHISETANKDNCIVQTDSVSTNIYHENEIGCKAKSMQNIIMPATDEPDKQLKNCNETNKSTTFINSKKVTFKENTPIENIDTWDDDNSTSISLSSSSSSLSSSSFGPYANHENNNINVSDDEMKQPELEDSAIIYSYSSTKEARISVTLSNNWSNVSNFD